MQKIGTLEQMVDEFKSGVHDFTKDGECIGCGACCSNLLPLSTKEIKTIWHYIKKKHIKEQKCLYPLAAEIINMTCPFRSEVEQKCLIYEIRPEICRDFKCDKFGLHGKASNKLMNGRYEVVDMRETFYGEANK